MDWIAWIYETFSVYSRDMGEHLRGWDVTCTDYMGTFYYGWLFWAWIGIVVFTLLLYYKIIDSPRLVRAWHLWLFIGGASLLNFIVGYSIANSAVQEGNYCPELAITQGDVVGVGITQCLLTLMLAAALSFVFRYASTNCRNTTLLRPW
jgi:hypothetical protein